MLNDEVPICTRCKTKKNVRYRYQIIRNGTFQHFWLCTGCGHKVCRDTGGAFIPKSKVDSWIASGALSGDFLSRALHYDHRMSCEVCGSLGSETHHFAPQSGNLFWGENRYRWKTSELCVSCHRKWHTIVTPYLPGYKSEYGEWWVDGMNNPEFYIIPVRKIASGICEVCLKKLPLEEHHFAPRSAMHLFGELWEKWPSSMLCANCHRLWHEIVTPYLPGYAKHNIYNLQRKYDSDISPSSIEGIDGKVSANSAEIIQFAG